MNFLKQHTVIPVPTIFHYDRDEDGAVGGEWMVMEYVEGTSLRLAWPKMDPQDRQQICLQAADIWVHIINTHFPAIGSLHSSPSSPFGVEVGPMAQIPPHNAFDVAPPNILKSGPFHSISSWLSTLARQELSFIRSLPPDPQQPEYTNGALAEIEWLAHSNSFNSITNHPASSFVLEHVEFSPQNIIISNNRPFRIVSVVDWEGARVVPLWATNPHWSWWIDFWTREEIEENRHYEKLMRDRVAELSPRWSGAMGDECKAFRMLHNRCKHCTTFLDPDTNSKLYQFLFSLG
ncbi:hypothetical protein DL96DRAFT_1600181 [Flagelloscypha sp. PMI_526]|nr:hypothetical protein DL96DRAFT_1600181 [Flagelloscypha sp. PMI_526]